MFFRCGEDRILHRCLQVWSTPTCWWRHWSRASHNVVSGARQRSQDVDVPTWPKTSDSLDAENMEGHRRPHSQHLWIWCLKEITVLKLGSSKCESNQSPSDCSWWVGGWQAVFVVFVIESPWQCCDLITGVHLMIICRTIITSQFSHEMISIVRTKSWSCRQKQQSSDVHLLTFTRLFTQMSSASWAMWYIYAGVVWFIYLYYMHVLVHIIWKAWNIEACPLRSLQY